MVQLVERRRILSKKGEVDYSKQYLTFKPLEDAAFKCAANIKYSLDNGVNWISLSSNTFSPVVSAGSSILWKDATKGSVLKFDSTGDFVVFGNIMSLPHGDNFINQTNLDGVKLKQLFMQCTHLINAENLILPTIVLTDEESYASMFYGCSSLIIGPKLPATTLTRTCYQSMFNGCTSLENAPELPATTLAESCYENMFYNCKSLKTAPELLAITLADRCCFGMFRYCSALMNTPKLQATVLSQYCYTNMFQGCTLVNRIECLATDISANSCLYNWVGGVSATGTFVKDASMTSWPTGNSGIPSGWTVEDA